MEELLRLHMTRVEDQLSKLETGQEDIKKVLNEVRLEAAGREERVKQLEKNVGGGWAGAGAGAIIVAAAEALRLWLKSGG